MKKTFWSCERIYILLFVVIVVGALWISSMKGDVKSSNARIAEENLSNNAEIFAAYFDSKIESSLNHLRQLGKEANIAINQNSDSVQELLKGYKPLFSSLSILTVQGAQEYGDRMTSMKRQQSCLQCRLN